MTRMPSPNETPPVRSLRAGEESAYLALLRGWPFHDERKGDVFFARSLHDDPSYEPKNVWIAEQGDALVSCCQIFPRPLRIAGEAVPAGGIGAVFTTEEFRGQGLARRVIAAALGEMQRRGLELALLWSSQLHWYQDQGFRRWGTATRTWSLRDGLVKPRYLGPVLSIEQFDPTVHLQAVQRLSASYCAQRHGTVVRGKKEWRASLALAGNPVEEFVVAMDDQLCEAIAFLRGCMLDGSWQVLEWACAPGHESHLAELIAVTLGTVAQTSVIAPALADDRLERCLQERGLCEQEAPEGTPEWLLRCLDAEALARRFGISQESSAGEEGVASVDILAMVLPPPTFHFWTADRF